MMQAADSLQINGHLRPLHNSAGKLIHPRMSGILRFWAWFGESQMIDANGRPLVAFHGTANEFEGFDAANLGGSTQNSGFYGAGHYFSPSASDAAGYAMFAAQRPDRQSCAPAIVPVYLSLPHPLYVHVNPACPQSRSRCEEGLTRLIEVLASSDLAGMRPGADISSLRSCVTDADFERAMSRLYSGYGGGQGIRLLAQAAGFDGVQVWGHKGGQDFLEQVVAFDATQIKSAIGNAGTFSAKTPSLTEHTAMNVARVHALVPVWSTDDGMSMGGW